MADKKPPRAEKKPKAVAKAKKEMEKPKPLPPRKSTKGPQPFSYKSPKV
jgi:hypothetical protein